MFLLWRPCAALFAFNVFSMCPSMPAEKMQPERSEYICTLYLLAIPLSSIQPLRAVYISSHPRWCGKCVRISHSRHAVSSYVNRSRAPCREAENSPQCKQLHHLSLNFWSHFQGMNMKSVGLVLQFSFAIIHNTIVKCEQTRTENHSRITFLLLLRLSMTVVETMFRFSF